MSDAAAGAMAPFPGMELTDEMRAAVRIEERRVPGPVGAPDVRVLLYRPAAAEGILPLIVSMHGGAFARRADNFPVADARLAMLIAVDGGRGSRLRLTGSSQPRRVRGARSCGRWRP